MSRSYSGAADANQFNSGALTTAASNVTICAWMKNNAALAAVVACVSVGNGTGNNNRLTLGRGASGEMSAISRTTSNSTAQSGTPNPNDTTTWHHGAAVFRSSTSRDAYCDGAQKGSNATSSTPTITGTVYLGSGPAGSLGWNGRMAHPAIWSVALDDDEIAVLGAGKVSPLMVRPQSLLFYVPYLGRDSTDIDIISRFDLTVGAGGATAIGDDEPPTLWLPKHNIFLPPESVGGTTYSKTMDENISLTDGNIDTIFRGRTMSETIAVTDENVVSRLRGRFFTDTISPVSDRNEVVKIRSRQGSDAISLTDAIFLLTRLRGRVQEDAITLIDQTATTVYRGKTMVDTTVISDGSVLSRQRGRYLTDSSTIAVIDQQFLSKVYGRLQSDNIGAVTDGQFLSRIRGNLFSDNIALTDQATLSRFRDPTQTDTITVIDGVMVTRLFTRIMGDFISAITDTFLASLFTGRLFQLTLTDTIALIDEAIVSRRRGRTQGDAVLVGDEELDGILRGRFNSDGITLSDGTFLSRQRLRLFTDALTITDEELDYLRRTVVASDFIAATDETLVMRLRGRVLFDSLTVFDAFSFNISQQPTFTPMTLEVRVRISARDPVVLGQSTYGIIGADDDVKLGGYN
jgi:hypothetical protein